MLPEEMDVTEFIESGKYEPDSCNGHLVGLIKIAPKVINPKADTLIIKGLRLWYQNKGIKIQSSDVPATSSYRYTCFASNKPWDVYSMTLKVDSIQVLFFRYNDNAQLEEGFSTEGWIINDCHQPR
jgi:hypothetical protein